MDNDNATQSRPEETPFRLSDLLKSPVWLGEDKFGSLCDLVIVDNDVAAEVTHVCVSRPFGRPRAFVPWSHVQKLTRNAVRLDPQTPTSNFEKQPTGAVLLHDFIVDKRVLDTDGREVEVVYDVMLATQADRLYVVGVDLSRRALLRRMGLKWLANLTAGITDTLEKDIVAWKFIEPLPEGIGSFAGDLRLKVVREQVAKMPPIDVARILEQLGREQRLAVFNGMEMDHASDALEALDPRSQREVVASLSSEKARQLLSKMTPGQAADVLAALPWSDVHRILDMLDPTTADKVRQILEDQDQRLVNYISTDYVKLHPDTTVGQARQLLRQAMEREAVAYLYVADAGDHLLGLVSAIDLLAASDETCLKQLMKGNPQYLYVDSTLKEATEMFARYGFRALPVTDRHGAMQGIVLYRDVMNLRYRDME